MRPQNLQVGPISANADGPRDYKSIISRCTLGVITRQQALVNTESTQTDSCQLLAHVHGEAYLVDLLSTYTNTFATNTVTKRTDGARALLYSCIGVYTVV